MIYNLFETNCILCGKELQSNHRQMLGFCKKCQDKMGLIDESHLYDNQLEKDTRETENEYPKVKKFFKI